MSGNWKNKILNHEETPPEGVWENIAGKLDENESIITPDLATKMATHEEVPPLDAWNAITAELDKEEGTPVVTMLPNTGKRRTLYRMIAAAAAIILIVFSLVLYNNSGDKKKESTDPFIANNTKDTVNRANDSSVIDKNNLATIDTASSQRIVPVLPERINKQELASVQETINIDRIDYVKANEPVELSGNPLTNNNDRIYNDNGSYAINTDLINSPDRYVIVTGPDGSSKRVSSKLSSYIGYLNNGEPEEAIDIIIREAALWKSKFKDWSNKMISNDISPTLSNFMDVIELSNLLTEQK